MRSCTFGIFAMRFDQLLFRSILFLGDKDISVLFKGVCVLSLVIDLDALFVFASLLLGRDDFMGLIGGSVKYSAISTSLRHDFNSSNSLPKIYPILHGYFV